MNKLVKRIVALTMAAGVCFSCLPAGAAEGVDPAQQEILIMDQTESSETSAAGEPAAEAEEVPDEQPGVQEASSESNDAEELTAGPAEPAAEEISSADAVAYTQEESATEETADAAETAEAQEESATEETADAAETAEAQEAPAAEETADAVAYTQEAPAAEETADAAETAEAQEEPAAEAIETEENGETESPEIANPETEEFSWDGYQIRITADIREDEKSAENADTQELLKERDVIYTDEQREYHLFYICPEDQEPAESKQTFELYFYNGEEKIFLYPRNDGAYTDVYEIIGSTDQIDLLIHGEQLKTEEITELYLKAEFLRTDENGLPKGDPLSEELRISVREPVVQEQQEEEETSFVNLYANDDEGPLLWFEADRTWLYTDGGLLLSLKFSQTAEEYLQEEGVSVVYSVYPTSGPGHLGEEIVNSEQTIYYELNQENHTLFLRGQELYHDYGDFDIIVYAELVRNPDSPEAEEIDYTGVVCQMFEPVIEYDREWDRDMFPGWGDTVDHYYNVFIRNSDYPDGWNEEYEVTDVQIVSQTPEQAGRMVVSLHRDTDQNDENNYWWYYEAVSYGEAVLEVFYLDLDGTAASYQFTLSVTGDLYELQSGTEDNAFTKCPGESVNLWAKGRHMVDGGEDITEGMRYEWMLDEKGAQVASVSVDPDDSRNAVVTFNGEIDENQNGMAFMVFVTLYDGTDSEGSPIPRARNGMWLRISDSYTEVYPTMYDSKMIKGSTWTSPFELRLYELGKEYQVLGDVHFRWYYDQNAVEIRDAQGNPVGNNDEQGQYIDSEASYGTNPEFTILRKEDWYTEIHLTADYGDDQHTDTVYYLDQMNYHMWLDTETGRDTVYTDGELNVFCNMSDDLQNAAQAEGFELRMKAGIPDYDSGDDSWSIVFDESCCEMNGNVITLKGSPLWDIMKDSGTDHFSVEVYAMNGDTELGRERRDYRVEEAVEEYDMEQDREMLPNWDGSVDQYYNVRIRNTEYPDGFDVNYEVIDVKIVSQQPETQGRIVAELHRDEDENNPDNYWWYYRVYNRGEAVLQITYLDLSGVQKTYQFTLYVKGDVYDLDSEIVDESNIGLPGDSVNLRAQGRHHKEDSEDITEGMDYVWTLDEEGSQVASIAADPQDSRNAVLTFHKDIEDDQDGLWIKVTVTLYDGTDSAGNPVERAKRSEWVCVTKSYAETWPTMISRDLLKGDSETIPFELRLYEYGKEYTTAENVHFRWYYDQNAVEIRDADGNVVGNDDEQGEYNDSEASHGTILPFTIYRKENWCTDLQLHVDYTDDYGNDQDAYLIYTLYNRAFDLWLDTETGNSDLYTDGTLDVSCNMSQDLQEFTEKGACELKVTVGVVNYDEGDDSWTAVFPQNICYDLNDNVITLKGEPLKKALENYDTDQIIVEVCAVKGDTELSRVQRDFNVHDVIEDYQREWDRCVLPGWGGSIDSVYSVYVQNTQYPYGQDLMYCVTDVEIIETWGGDDDRDAVVLHASDNKQWWFYEAQAYGGARLQVTYENLIGGSDSYTFDVNVNDEVFDLNIQVEDGSEIGLPGTDKNLEAELIYFTSEQKEPPQNITFEWCIPDEYHKQFAELITDPQDSGKAKVRFFDLPDGWDRMWENIRVEVRAYCILDGGTEPEEVYCRDIWLTAAYPYSEIYPLEINSDLKKGAKEQITAEVHRYASLSESGYDLVPEVAYRWEYDENAVEVLDADGNKVGNYDAEGVYQGSEASVGTKVSFTILRLMEYETDICLRADFTDEYGNDYSEQRSYRLNELPYGDASVVSLTLDQKEVTLETQKTLQLTAKIEPENAANQTVLWTSSDTKIATVDQNGVVTAKTYGTAVITATAEDTANGTISAECTVNTLYYDVAGSPNKGDANYEYWYTPVYWAADSSITKGYGNVYFGPEENCTREQMITFLYREAGSPPVSGTVPFSDVAKGKYYYNAVLWAYNNGITKGYSSGPHKGKFGVGLTVTREDTVTFLYRMAGSPSYTSTKSFTDVAKGKYYYNAIMWAAQNGITNGYSSGPHKGKFGVGFNVLRKDIVTFIYRYHTKFAG